MKKLDIYLVGCGGQGILTIAELITRAAEAKGVNANFFPTKGMAQRGGFVKAELRLGPETVGPDIHAGGADLVIAMELSESLKALRYLKKGGDFVVYGYNWLPTDVMLGKADYPQVEDVKAAAAKIGAHTVYLDPGELPEGAADNIYLLAAAVKQSCLGELFSAEDIENAIVKRWPKGADRNQASFAAGLAAQGK
ncbi:MAG: 2-oxoacid:acceptor oxidoreductase family protein [Bacillota bacterium]|nr:2-oxoacid:acceptor oxidoreductase family protein [Bacillota bacterium]